MIESYSDRQAARARAQPHFREWSAAAQPNGYPDRIIVTYGECARPAVDRHRAREGRLHGVAVAGLSRATRSRLATRRRCMSSRHRRPTAAFLNTRLPPFNKLAARQAFSYAIDRSKAIPGFGGVKEAAVTCQIIPAGMAGYRPYCPFTRNPTRNGVWTGPDLAKAQKLVTASGTRGQKVVIWTGDLPFERVIGESGARNAQEARISTPRRRFSANTDYFEPRERLAYGGTGRLLRLGTGLSGPVELSDAVHMRRIPAGEPRTTSTSPRSATHASTRPSPLLWPGRRPIRGPRRTPPGPRVDRLVTDLAPWAPIVNSREAVVVSRRVGNVQSNPQWGVLIDQMWVR